MNDLPITWLYQPEQPGLLQLRGRDQLAFVQRQTSNNTNNLGPQTGQISVLTTPMARILDVFFIYRDVSSDEPIINLVTLPGRGPATARYLKSRIFFNDQVNLQDASTATRQFWLDGTQAALALANAGVKDFPLLDEVRMCSLAGQDVVLVGRRGVTGMGYLLIIPGEGAAEVENALNKAGAESIGHSEYETMRIEAGLPGYQAELTEAYTPYEVGLDYAISGNKGCYTGQEVLARQVTYDKITRRLCGLRLQNPVPTSATVLVEGKPAGEITSSTLSPRFGPIALAVLKRPFFEPGTSVEVKSGEAIIPGITCKLPF